MASQCFRLSHWSIWQGASAVWRRGLEGTASAFGRRAAGGCRLVQTSSAGPLRNAVDLQKLGFDSSDAEAAKNMSTVFELLQEDGLLSVPQFIKGLQACGIRETDFRFRETMKNFRMQAMSDDLSSLALDQETFTKCTKDNAVLILRAFKNTFVINEFGKFTSFIDNLYWECKANNGGEVASYIPQLSRYSPDYWGVSLCTIDGQRHSVGDTSVPFCLQSCSKPLSYAFGLHELGPEVVHQYVGQEPSGRSFNELVLDKENKPHNPMINSGAIVMTSLVKRNLALPDRFDYFTRMCKALSGGEFVGFHNPTFLSERDTADRNYALAYFMKENKCFPEGVNVKEVLDFYFQCCSVEVTASTGAVLAATLANGGICPTTNQKLLSSDSIRNTLSLMYSCGMYDYSGQFAFTVGVPAKSGVAGGILLVIPNVMGMCLWSPPLDVHGNSVRGVEFCKKLVDTFNFHNYDNLRHTTKQMDPRKRTVETKVSKVASLLYAGYHNDVTFLTRQHMSGDDMSLHDYDGRTALHVAAAEGHIETVKFLVDKCGVSPYLKDRWGRTPMEDAVSFNQTIVREFLEKVTASET